MRCSQLLREFLQLIAIYFVTERLLNQNEANYHRALVWTAVMSTLSHLDPNMASVFALEAANGMSLTFSTLASN